MATRPKSISITELTSAVQKALLTLKVKPTPEEGPWPWINPVICGIIYRGPLVEARPIADAIAKQVSQGLDTPVIPVIEESAAGAEGAKATLPPGHIIMGFRPEKAISF